MHRIPLLEKQRSLFLFQFDCSSSSQDFKIAMLLKTLLIQGSLKWNTRSTPLFHCIPLQKDSHGFCNEHVTSWQYLMPQKCHSGPGRLPVKTWFNSSASNLEIWGEVLQIRMTSWRASWIPAKIDCYSWRHNLNLVTNFLPLMNTRTKCFRRIEKHNWIGCLQLAKNHFNFTCTTSWNHDQQVNTNMNSKYIYGLQMNSL